MGVAAGVVVAWEAAAVGTAVSSGLVSVLGAETGMLVESEFAATGGAALIVACVGAASEIACVVWALAGSAVNNKTSATAVLLNRRAKVLWGVSIFLLL